jgi:hypothetical protein
MAPAMKLTRLLIVAISWTALGLTTLPAHAAGEEDADATEDAKGGDDEPGADDDGDRKGKSTQEQADKWHVLDFMTFGVGIVGQVGAAILDKPDDQTVGGVDYTLNSEYPGFFGVASAVGPKIEFRFFGYGGIELQFLFGSASGSAELEHTDLGSGAQQKFNIEIGQGETHIPLLFKGVLPGEWVNPFVFIGPEFVIAGDATCEGDCIANPGNTDYAATKEGYTAFAFGLGLEVNLPIPTADIRIPLSLKGNFNPGVSSKRDERATHTVGGAPANINSENFSTAWKFQAVGNFGAAWHF